MLFALLAVALLGLSNGKPRGNHHHQSFGHGNHFGWQQQNAHFGSQQNHGQGHQHGHQSQSGAMSPEQLIVGGSSVLRSAWPFIVSLQAYRTRDSHFCGGTLIKPNVVLTAAHCLAYSNIFIENGNASSPRKIKVLEMVQHEDYNKGAQYNNDIALLKLAGNFTTADDQVGFAQLPDQGYQPNSTAKTLCKVAGWGTIYSGGPSSRDLYEVEKPYVNNIECQNAYGVAVITDNMLCSGATNKDACQGDSGGPLIFSDTPGVVQGVVSWGYGCGHPEYPGVYARVSSFTDWINENLNNMGY